jgi:hypothetical protein
VHDFPTVDPVNATINKTIRTLMADRDMDPPALWNRAVLTKGTYYNRMKGRGEWTSGELKRVADALGVSVATLFRASDDRAVQAIRSWAA